MESLPLIHTTGVQLNQRSVFFSLSKNTPLVRGTAPPLFNVTSRPCPRPLCTTATAPRTAPHAPKSDIDNSRQSPTPCSPVLPWCAHRTSSDKPPATRSRWIYQLPQHHRATGIPFWHTPMTAGQPSSAGITDCPHRRQCRPAISAPHTTCATPLRGLFRSVSRHTTRVLTGSFGVIYYVCSRTTLFLPGTASS